MREIKYRGKCQSGYDYSDGDGWVYGSLLTNGKESAIIKEEDIDIYPGTDDGINIIEDFGCIPVDSETVGQLTGHKDKNKKQMFSGDICELEINFAGMATEYWEEPCYNHKYTGYVHYSPSRGYHLKIFKCWDLDEDAEIKISPTVKHIVQYRTEIIGNIHEDVHLLDPAQ